MVKEKVFVPLLKSLATGLLVALFAASFFIASVPLKLFCLVVSGVALAAWVAMAWKPSYDRSKVQRNTRSLDLASNDRSMLETTRIQITATDPSSAFTHGKFANLPVDISTLIKVAKWLDNGADFSMAGLSGRYRPLTRSEFESLRTAMIRDGLLFWRDPANHAQGCELTLAGGRVIKYYAGLGGNGSMTTLPQLQKPNGRVKFSPSKARARGRAWRTKTIDGRD